jgi:hypothetical protein
MVREKKAVPHKQRRRARPRKIKQMVVWSGELYLWLKDILTI